MKDYKYNQFFDEIGYTFQDMSLLERALTHRSCQGLSHNERLEFFGDSILCMLTSEMIFTKFSNSSEGHLSNMRASLIKSDTLSYLGKQIGLDKLVKADTNLLLCQDRLIADALEALIAAIYLDSNLENVKNFIQRLYQDIDIYKMMIEDPNNAKSLLQEKTIIKFGYYPKYNLIQQDDKKNHHRFTVKLYCQGWEKSYLASGKTIKQAEKKAAYQALQDLLNNA